MKADEIRCIRTRDGKEFIVWMPPSIANDVALMRHKGMVKAEIEKPLNGTAIIAPIENPVISEPPIEQRTFKDATEEIPEPKPKRKYTKRKNTKTK